MNLQELLDHQATLNSSLTTTPTHEQLLAAVIAETGELLNEIKPQWAWWKRNDKEFHTNDLRTAEELADILCFLLTGALQIKHEQRVTNRNWFRATEAKLETTTSELCAILIGECLSGFYLTATTQTFSALCCKLGYSRQQIEAVYLQKVAINKQRWG